MVIKQMGNTEKGCELEPLGCGAKSMGEMGTSALETRQRSRFGWEQPSQVPQSRYLGRSSSQDNLTFPYPWGSLFCEIHEST